MRLACGSLKYVTRPFDTAGDAHPRKRGGDGEPANCAHERDLRRLRRELHDRVGSELSAISMQLELARRLTAERPERAREVLAELSGEVDRLLAGVRRMVAGREPEPAGCGDAERALRNMLAKVSDMFGPQFTLNHEIDPRLRESAEEVVSTVFWIVREAVTNVLKHSRARRCLVSVRVRDGEVHVRVQDDGAGLPDRDGGPVPDGRGISNMAERAREHGGWCTIQQARPRGVVVRAVLPRAARRRAGE